MTRPRRWSAGAWRAAVAKRPIMHQLGRGLIWGIYARTTLEGSYALDEHGQLVDFEGRPAKLRKKIGPIHPSQLSSTERERWLEYLAERGLEQPFSQLQRAMPSVPTGIVGDRPSTYSHLFERFVGKKIGAKEIEALLRRGWYRGGATSSHVTSLHFGNAWNGWSGTDWTELALHMEFGIRSHDHTGTRGSSGKVAITRVSFEHDGPRELRRHVAEAIVTLDEVLGP